MIKRTIEISGPQCAIKLQDRQLKIYRERVLVGSVPAEDIGILIIDTPTARYTHSTLTAVLEAGGVVVLAGADHNPVGMILPIAGNALLGERTRLQVEAKRPTQKRVWQQLIRAKITRQAGVLGPGSAKYRRLLELAAAVRSGDPNNLEAQAARLYWPELLGKEFRRRRKGPAPNNLLNYGYMALRAAVARAICGSGLLPALGVSHHNRYNPFCLADDLIEPFRPLVDQEVSRMHIAGKTELDRSAKAALLGLLSCQVTTGSGQGPLLIGLSRMTSSLLQCYSGEETQLFIPEVCPPCS